MSCMGSERFGVVHTVLPSIIYGRGTGTASTKGSITKEAHGTSEGCVKAHVKFSESYTVQMSHVWLWIYFTQPLLMYFGLQSILFPDVLDLHSELERT